MKKFLRVLIGLEGWRQLDSWERVEFDFANYSPLRDSGLSHKDACRELDRLWEGRT